MDQIFCRECGTPYRPGEASFCSKCGTPLPTKANAVDELKSLQKESRGYGALRFTADLIIFLGWLIIISGFFLSAGVYKSVNVISSQSDAAILAAIMTIIFSLFMGVFSIASGQFLELMLEMRDDLHVNTRLLRRLSLMISEQ